MNPCPEFGLTVMEWVDGEADAATADLCRQHVDSCPICRAYTQALGSLSARLEGEVVPAPRSDLAARVIARLPKPVTHGWWARLRQMMSRLAFRRPWQDGPHPLLDVIESRVRRRGGRFNFTMATLLFTVPMVGQAVFSSSQSVVTFAVTSAVLVALLVPVAIVAEHVLTVVRLKRGRCLEELMCTGLTAQGVVDALALRALTETARVCALLAPTLLLGVLVVSTNQDVASFFGINGQNWLDLGLSGAGMAIGWLMGTVLVACQLSYLIMASMLWLAPGTTWMAALVAVSGGLLLPLAALVPVQAAGLAAIGLYGACLLWYRGASIWALENWTRLEGWSQRAGTRRTRSHNRRSVGWTDNPVIIRELLYRTSEKPLAILITRAIAAIVPGAWALYLARAAANWNPERGVAEQDTTWQLIFIGGLALVWASAWFGAAVRTLPAVAQERERGTWESLQQTGLSMGSFIRGWLVVGVLQFAIELIPLAAVIGLMGAIVPAAATGFRHADAGATVLVLALVTVVGLGLSGALTGLALSTSYDTFQAGFQRLLALSLRWGALWLAVWGALFGGSFVVAELGLLDADSYNWSTVLVQVLPMVASLLVCSGLALWSWSLIRRNLLPLTAPTRMTPEADSVPAAPVAATVWATTLAVSVVCKLVPAVEFPQDNPLRLMVTGALVGVVVGVVSGMTLAPLWRLLIRVTSGSFLGWWSLLMGAGCLAMAGTRLAHQLEEAGWLPYLGSPPAEWLVVLSLTVVATVVARQMARRKYALPDWEPGMLAWNLVVSAMGLILVAGLAHKYVYVWVTNPRLNVPVSVTWEPTGSAWGLAIQELGEQSGRRYPNLGQLGHQKMAFTPVQSPGQSLATEARLFELQVLPQLRRAARMPADVAPHHWGLGVAISNLEYELVGLGRWHDARGDAGSALDCYLLALALETRYLRTVRPFWYREARMSSLAAPLVELIQSGRLNARQLARVRDWARGEQLSENEILEGLTLAGRFHVSYLKSLGNRARSGPPRLVIERESRRLANFIDADLETMVNLEAVAIPGREILPYWGAEAEYSRFLRNSYLPMRDSETCLKQLESLASAGGR